VKLTRQIWLSLTALMGCPFLPTGAAESGGDTPAVTALARSNAPQFGTIQLFNGRNLDGLQTFLEDPAADPAKTWQVQDGILRCTGTPQGYVRTRIAYADYRLHVEWRWPNGKGNSGVMLHIVNRDEIWPKSFEANLQVGRVGDINNFWDARTKGEVLGRVPGRFTTGRVVRPATESAEKPLGEWNAFDIVASGDTITLTVNGVEVNRVTGVTPSGGMIGLQSEGGALVEFRNMMLTPLPPAKELHAPMPSN
jgi:hypothetical protein